MLRTATRPRAAGPAADPRDETEPDLTTDATGRGHAEAVGDSTFFPVRRPGSVIIHAQHTARGSAAAGTAGQRVACLTVPF